MLEPISISALQHYIFCKRQCALIHIEGLWAENRLTVEGNVLHRKAHGEAVGPRGGRRAETRPERGNSSRTKVRTVRGLALCSESLGITGKADVVEFRVRTDQTPSADPSNSTALNSAGAPSPSTPFPIEYKRGRPKRHDADIIQLCAQALCLEDMLNLGPGGIPAGAIYYGQTKHRLEVPFDAALRARTLHVITECRRLIESGLTPRAVREKKCDRCSLFNLCIPDATGPGASASKYLARSLSQFNTTE